MQLVRKGQLESRGFDAQLGGQLFDPVRQGGTSPLDRVERSWIGASQEIAKGGVVREINSQRKCIPARSWNSVAFRAHIFKHAPDDQIVLGCVAQEQDLESSQEYKRKWDAFVMRDLPKPFHEIFPDLSGLRGELAGRRGRPGPGCWESEHRRPREATAPIGRAALAENSLQLGRCGSVDRNLRRGAFRAQRVASDNFVHLVKFLKMVR